MIKVYETQPPKKNRNAYKAWMYFQETYCDDSNNKIGWMKYDPRLKIWSAYITFNNSKSETVKEIGFLDLEEYKFGQAKPKTEAIQIDDEDDDEDIFS